MSHPTSTPHDEIPPVKFTHLCYALADNLNQDIPVTDRITPVADYTCPENPQHVVTLFVQATKDRSRAHQHFTIKKKHMTNDLLETQLATLAGKIVGDRSLAQSGYSINYAHPDHYPHQALLMFARSTRPPAGAATPPPDQHIPEPDPILETSAMHAPSAGDHLLFFGERMIDDNPLEIREMKTRTRDRGYLVMKKGFVMKKVPRDTTIGVGLYMQIARARATQNSLEVSFQAAKPALKRLAAQGQGASDIIMGALFKFVLHENIHEDFKFPDEVSNIDPNASSSSSPSSGSNAPSPGEGGQGPSAKRGRSTSSSSGNDMGKGKGKGNSGGLFSGAKKKTKS